MLLTWNGELMIRSTYSFGEMTYAIIQKSSFIGIFEGSTRTEFNGHQVNNMALKR